MDRAESSFVAPGDSDNWSYPGDDTVYMYRRSDGTLEQAKGKQDAVDRCPILGRVALEDPEQLMILLDLAATGNKILQEKEQLDFHPEEEVESDVGADDELAARESAYSSATQDAGESESQELPRDDSTEHKETKQTPGAIMSMLSREASVTVNAGSLKDEVHSVEYHAYPIAIDQAEINKNEIVPSEGTSKMHQEIIKKPTHITDVQHISTPSKPEEKHEAVAQSDPLEAVPPALEQVVVQQEFTRAEPAEVLQNDIKIPVDKQIESEVTQDLGRMLEVFIHDDVIPDHQGQAREESDLLLTTVSFAPQIESAPENVFTEIDIPSQRTADTEQLTVEFDEIDTSWESDAEYNTGSDYKETPMAIVLETPIPEEATEESGAFFTDIHFSEDEFYDEFQEIITEQLEIEADIQPEFIYQKASEMQSLKTTLAQVAICLDSAAEFTDTMDTDEETDAGDADPQSYAKQQDIRVLFHGIHQIIASSSDENHENGETHVKITPELLDSIITLLRRIGYTQPEKVLAEYIDTFGIEYLLYVFRYIYLNRVNTAGEGSHLVRTFYTAAGDVGHRDGSILGQTVLRLLLFKVHAAA